jgi:hypothetical protein
MGTFAETVIVDTVYHLPTKENKLPVFPILFAANKRKFVFLFSVCNEQPEVAVFR